MNAGALGRAIRVQVVRDYSDRLPPITVDKHKVLQILVNLIRNAKYACDESGRPDKRLTMRVRAGRQDRVRISVQRQRRGHSRRKPDPDFQPRLHHAQATVTVSACTAARWPPRNWAAP